MANDDFAVFSQLDIQFNTIYEHRLYQVVSVGLSEVAYQDENSYRYYNFIQANNMEEWQEFVDNVNSLAIYQSDVTLEPSDEILTLSTCNSYTEDGRLFIVAKRIHKRFLFVGKNRRKT